MDAERWRRITEAFDAALELPSGARTAHLDRACGDDGGMRSEVLRLLAEFEQAGDFLEAPALGPSHAFVPGDRVGGRYRIEALIGRGGMGEVYRAFDQTLGEQVALKALRPEISHEANMLKRFRREVELARRIRHENVCRVYDYGEQATGRGTIHFFTMELLEGETLAERARRSAMSREEAFPLIVQMAQGLAAAHAEGVIHRDFKSANVILTAGAPPLATRAVITDFGLARMEARAIAGEEASQLRSLFAPATITTTALVAGTVAYMSPEQLAGEEVTAASDIYSLGIVLYEMATGQLPFDDRHIIQSAMQRVSQIDMRPLKPGLDPKWASAIERCMRREPARRFRSAAAVAEHIQPNHWRPAMTYWSRREWLVRAAAAAVPVAAVGAAWRYMHRPYQQRPEAAAWFQKGFEGVLAMTYDAARKALEQAVMVDAAHPLSHAYLSAAYAELDAQDKARAAMAKAHEAAAAVTLSDEDAARLHVLDAILNRRFADAEVTLARLAEASSGEPRAARLVELAWIQQKAEQNQAASAALKEALRIDANLASALLRLATIDARQGNLEGSLQRFAQAESLFSAAGNYDALAEAYLQKALILGRAKRNAESIAVTEKGLALSRNSGDANHEVRFRLVQSLVYRNGGELAKSRGTAAVAVDTARKAGMDSPAAVGLIDLGNAHFIAGELSLAEEYFRRGLDFARRGGALFSQARAELSLASLFTDLDRPADALPLVERSAKFFRSANYPKETLSAQLVLGNARQGLGESEAARAGFTEAERLAAAAGDTEQQGMALGFRAEADFRLGEFPRAIEDKSRAVQLFGDVRGGYRAAFAYQERSRIWIRLGRYGQAFADLAQAMSYRKRLEGPQPQLELLLALSQAELAYARERWPQTLAHARRAMLWEGGGPGRSDARLQVEMLASLARWRTGHKEGFAECSRVITEAAHRQGGHLAATMMLACAEAWARLGKFAEAGEAAVQSERLWSGRAPNESAWRLCALRGEQAEGRKRLAALKMAWPEEMFATYTARPEVAALIDELG